MISKKELLEMTGISYGQLYRWKREKLIPEEWFVKQASFTGQETFFPREKILTRIRIIQEMKDQYSLEELAQIISPDLFQRRFTTQDLTKIEEITPDVINAFTARFTKDTFTYIEALVMSAVSKAIKNHSISDKELQEIIRSIGDTGVEIKNSGYLLLLIRFDRHWMSAFIQENAQFSLDRRLEVLENINLSELSEKIQLKYQKIFQTIFNQED